MTREEAIRVGVFTLADWHRRDHGQRCVCLEAEQFGAQSAALIDPLAAQGVPLLRRRFSGPTRPAPTRGQVIERVRATAS
jgi:hypothetical protein